MTGLLARLKISADELAAAAAAAGQPETPSRRVLEALLRRLEATPACDEPTHCLEYRTAVGDVADVLREVLR